MSSKQPPTESNSTTVRVDDQPKRQPIRCLFRWVRDMLAVVGLVSIVYHVAFDLSVVISGSMSPTLCGNGGANDDWVLTERVSYWFREPHRWEVVQFETDDHMLVEKRIVGMPGETIALIDNKPVIDGTPMPPPESLSHLRYIPQAALSDGRTQSCGTGYYMLGDDSEDSWDSRFDGPIQRKAIRGRAWLILWPPSRIGFVNE